jgi:hypothetical protein
MGYLSEEQLQNLRNYKYSGVDKSFVSRYILQPYWNRLVQLFPLWVAPNLITLIGFCCILINLATVLAYDYDLSGECPRWAYFTQVYMLATRRQMVTNLMIDLLWDSLFINHLMRLMVNKHVVPAHRVH